MDQVQFSALFDFLKGVPDPRKPKGQHYEWHALLQTISMALLSGQVNGRAMAQWASLHAEEIIRDVPGVRQRIPSDSTLRRVLQRVDEEALERQMGQYAQALDEADDIPGRIEGPDGREMRGQAIDGKEVRGAGAHGVSVNLVSVTRHESGLVLTESKVAAKTNELGAIPELLAGRDLRGTVSTLDAMFTQRSVAQQIIAQGGDYLMAVKENQPTLYTNLETFFQNPGLPRGEDDRDTYTYTTKEHGRFETHTLTCSAALIPYLDWPGVQQVLQRRRQCLINHTGDTSDEVKYAVTSLSRQRAQARHLECLWRGHWTIEGKVHYVRDETLKEDRCQMYKGSAPRALAALKNGILAALRYWGWTNIAEALRVYGSSVHKAYTFLNGNAA